MALESLVSERGYAATTLDAVLERAAVDRATFDHHFQDFEVCYVQVWEERVGEFLEVTGRAFSAAGDWREGMRGAAWSYCRFLQEDRDRARFLIEMIYNSELVEASRDFVMSAYAQLVHLGCDEREEAADIPLATAEGVVGAIWEKVATLVLADRFAALPAAIPPLIYLTVLPYLGADVAEQELRRAPEDIARYERGELG
jgi:AcrR family transcriptional regulator